MNQFRLAKGTSEVMGLLATAKANTASNLQKGFTLPSSPSDGLHIFPISPELQVEYSVETPLKNILPRTAVTGGIGYGFKVIREYDTTGVSGKVRDGERARFINQKVDNMPFIFVTWGFENYITFNAELASENMETRSQGIAIVQRTLTEMLSVDEERKIIGGQRTALGLISEVTATVNTDVAGSLEAGDVSVIAVPLSLYGLNQSSVANGVRLTHNEQNADGSIISIVGGYGVKKNIASAVTVTADSSLDILVEDVKDAVGYAVFAGSAGTERLVYVGASNKFNLKSLNNDTQLASALSSVDQSADNLDFDGLFALAGHSNATVVSLDGAELSVEGVYVPEFEQVISSIRDRKISVSHMVMNRATYTAFYRSIASKITNVNIGNGSNIISTFGSIATNYISTNNSKVIEFIIDDEMPSGHILFLSLGGASVLGGMGITGNLVEMVLQEDFNMIAWPLVTRSWQFGIYCTGVLAHKYPSSIGILKNIKV